MKKLLSWALVLIMTATMIPALAFADSECGENGHNWGEWQILDEPSCENDGYKYRECENPGCDEIQEESIPSYDEHDWVCDGVEKQLCIDNYVRMVCSRCCEEETKLIEADPNAHEWYVDWTSEAWCDKPAYDYMICVYCEQTKKVAVGEAPGHDWTKWITADSPGCKHVGYKYRECRECYDTERKSIPKLTAHKWGKWTLYKATRNEAGERVRECTSWDCEKKQTTTIPRITKPVWEKTKVVYDGKVHIPKVTIKDTKKKLLKKGTDYTVTIKNQAGKTVTKPKNIGKYKVTVTFKGDYKGKIVQTFTIQPKAPKINKLTKGSRQLTVSWSKVSTGITGYQVVCSENWKFYTDNKYVKVPKSAARTKTFKKLQPQWMHYVKVRSYKMVNGEPVYSNWSDVKKIRVGGKVEYSAFVKKGSKTYHKAYYCPKLSGNFNQMTLTKAKSKGYKVCKYCKNEKLEYIY